MKVLSVWTLLVSSGIVGVEGFYLPGVSPQSFSKGDEVKLKVNKMTSAKTLLPLEYYRMPFCQPDEGPVRDSENLGEFLSGDRIESSSYELNMKVDSYCRQLCSVNLGKSQNRGTSANKLTRAIRKEYHNNWIVDNLSSAYRTENANTYNVQYWEGFPIGFVLEDEKAYVHNHVNLIVSYHPVEDQTDKYRVVRFVVEPFSIKHQYTPTDNVEEGEDYVIANPIASCDTQIPEESRKHTSYEMITAYDREPQEANGYALFTYDVMWIEDLNLTWASRWDIYLNMENSIPNKTHWLAIANSLVIVVVLSAMIVTILLRNLRQDLARYNRVATDEEKADDLEEKGWKLVHADVFRPPNYSPLLLSVCCGTGAQLLCMAFWTIIFSALGFINPSRRGSLLMAELFFYVLMGSVAGYITARFYKTFKGKAWQMATICTAVGFPGLCFALFFAMDMMAWGYQSTDAVPFWTMLVLFLMWFGISTPLVFVGAYFGYKQDALEFPVKTSSIPRQIPDQPWFMGTPFTMLIGGILPFAACFVEYFYILSSVWMDMYYYVFGFLLLVFVILIVTVAEITVLFNYFQLCNEDYNWWWRSFGTGGSTAFWVFLNSIVYFRTLEVSSFPTYLLYFGYMGLVSVAVCMMTGFIGVASCLWFNVTIFGSVKVD
eukprot:Nitzschia sp. Nitz4//scaffold278_size24532//8986//11238//NITZ4_008375-RA/size24532-augustus-gene-0.14-mRNA-1//-1//CDS//3329545375//7551//frame0